MNLESYVAKLFRLFLKAKIKLNFLDPPHPHTNYQLNNAHCAMPISESEKVTRLPKEQSWAKNNFYFFCSVNCPGVGVGVGWVLHLGDPGEIRLIKCASGPQRRQRVSFLVICYQPVVRTKTWTDHRHRRAHIIINSDKKRSKITTSQSSHFDPRLPPPHLK